VLARFAPGGRRDVTVVVTHAHIDHIGGFHEFEEQRRRSLPASEPSGVTTDRLPVTRPRSRQSRPATSQTPLTVAKATGRHSAEPLGGPLSTAPASAERGQRSVRQTVRSAKLRGARSLCFSAMVSARASSAA